MALLLTAGGEDILPYTKFSTIRVEDSMEVKGDTMSFEVWKYDPGSPEPRSGQEVIFTDGSTREFAGVLVDVEYIMGEGNRLLIHRCQCMDYTYYLDRRALNTTFASQVADTMFGAILDNLQALAPDTHYDDFQGDKSQLDVGAPVARAQRAERIFPSQLFDLIAEGVGMQWWIDYNKVVNLRAIGNIYAPLPFEGSGPEVILDIDDDLVNFFNVDLSESILGVGNQSILKGAVTQSTGTKTDESDWHTGDSATIFFNRRPHDELNVTSVRRQGTLQTQRLEDVYLDANAEPATGEVALYIGPRDKPGTSYVRFRAADLVNNDTIELIYSYSVEDDHENIDAASQADMANRTGGNGVHEFVFSQLSGIVATSQTDLDEISEMILARKGKVIRRGSFSTYLKGWASGQSFIFKWTRLPIRETMYVTSVRKLIRTPGDDPNLSDNFILFEIQFSNIPRGVRM